MRKQTKVMHLEANKAEKYYIFPPAKVLRRNALVHIFMQIALLQLAALVGLNYKNYYFNLICRLADIA